MLRFIVFILFLFLPCTLFLGGKSSDSTPDSAERAAASDVEAYASLYRSMQLEGVVNWKAFRQAVAGYYKIDNRKREVLTLIDFSRPSTAKRLFVFDMRERKVLFSSVVSHGKNSGDNYATSFSNEYGSYKSSLGFYLTESTYQGKNGYSLILNGLEKGINDRAKERAIVVHGANYCSPSIAVSTGRLGRSFGCPALPPSLAKPIINTIKDGTLLYIYANDKEYLSQSTILSTGRSISPNSIIALNSLIRE